MAASIRDVSRKSPDRGVDLILSVAVSILLEDVLPLLFTIHSALRSFTFAFVSTGLY